MEIKKGKAGRKFQYELSFRRKVCEELLSGKITASDLARKYNIPARATIFRWVKWYKQEQEELLSSPPMENAQEKPENSVKLTNDLQKELEQAKAKIATLETMIDLAEEQFKIEIRKKSGTKPSFE